MPRRLLSAALALPIVLGATTFAPAAHADWRYHRGWGVGPAVVGGALVGLGVGALLAAPYVAPPPPPPVAYYPPPGYYPPPYPYAYPYRAPYAPYYPPY